MDTAKSSPAERGFPICERWWNRGPNGRVENPRSELPWDAEGSRRKGLRGLKGDLRSDSRILGAGAVVRLLMVAQMRRTNRPGKETMENPPSRRPCRVAVSRQVAFTLVELLAIIAVLALLVSVRLPALAKASQRTRQAQCANNLRQYALAIQCYGNEYGGKLPVINMGYWAFDLPVSVADLLAPFGATRPLMYCPAYPEQNNDFNWSHWGSYHATGYALTFLGTATVHLTNCNPTLTPQSIKYRTTIHAPPLAARRPLLADATMSYMPNEANREGDQFVGITGPEIPTRTSHLNGVMPAGGNIAMLDGHVEWRDFAAMHVRTTRGTYFWW